MDLIKIIVDGFADFIKTIGGVFSTFGVEWSLLLASLVNFAIVLVVLRLFAYKPLLKILEERKKRIADSLAQAEQIKQELAKTQAMRQEILNQSNLDAEQLLAEARAAAARLQDERLQDAIAQVENILRQAQQATRMERERMMAELKQEVGRLVIETTSKVTGKILTSDDQRRLSEETAKELAAR